MGKTLVSEFDDSSDTATYLDNIDPYTYSAREVYIIAPYRQYLSTQPGQADELSVFTAEPAAIQENQLKAASDYFGGDNDNTKVSPTVPTSPVMNIVNSLTAMAQSGLYEAVLVDVRGNSTFADGSTYSDRFLADTGVLEEKATALNITTDQYGMIREEKSGTPGAWWLLPIGVLNHTVLANDDNGDRDAAIIFGSLLLTMLAFPFIPYLNQLPDKLKVYRLIWGKGKA